MADDAHVSQWLQDLKAGDPSAAQRLWEHYFARLVRLASAKLPPGARRVADQEDVALSAFKSFFLGVERGRFPRLEDRDDLWRLLVVITSRKARAQRRAQTAQKRGGGKVQGESVFQQETTVEGDLPGIEQVMADEPTPEFAAEVADEVRLRLDQLGDDMLRSVALLKMEGCTVNEVAQRIGRSRRTVLRSLDLIRDIWSTTPDRQDPTP